MSGSVNALIPLSVNPSATAGPDLTGVMRLGQFQQELALRRQEIAQSAQLAQQRMAYQQQMAAPLNALRIMQLKRDQAAQAVFSNPDFMRPDGTLNAQGESALMRADPTEGMNYKHNQLVQEGQRIQQTVTNSELFSKKLALTTDANGAALEAYEKTLKDTGNPQAAQEAGQRVFTQQMDTVRKSGLFSDAELRGLRTTFDPQASKSYTLASKDWADRQRKERELQIKEGANVRLDDSTLTDMADQYLAGDKTVFQNLGRGAQGAANVVALRQRVYKMMHDRNMTGTDIAAKMAEFAGMTSAERALGTRTANVGMAVNEASQLSQLVQSTSDAVPRTNYPLLNSILLAGERGTGDTNVVRYGAALNSFINAYARAVSPTGAPTVSDKEHARDILATNWSKGQITAGLDQLRQEMQFAQRAPGLTREEIAETFGRKGPPVPEGTSAPWNPQAGGAPGGGQPATSQGQSRRPPTADQIAAAPHVKTLAEAMALPANTLFIDPSGKPRYR